jgi:fumarate reductase flavoprotein subunit
VSINGANRLGSNSLPECLVFGARAGRVAAEHAAQSQTSTRGLLALANDERRRLEQQFLHRTGGREKIATLRDQMHQTMETAAGIYRSGPALAKAAEKLRELQERFHDVQIDDRSHTFNTELTSALELSFMLDVAETMVACALERKESRGAHQRTDFVARDDKNYLAHSVINRNSDGSSRVEYLPVKITRWPPGERVYGTKTGTTVAQAR